MSYNNFKDYKLGEIVEISSSKRIYAKEYLDHGIPFYRGKEIIEKHKGNDISTELYISKERYNELKEKFGVPNEGDILLTSVGTLGVPYLVKNEEFYFKDGNLTWFKNFNSKCNNKFIYYWLHSPLAKEQIYNKSIGSTQKALTIDTLKKFNIKLPSLDIQNKTVDILCSIDNRIKLNDEMNKTLEEIAQALFKRWFVDFEFPNEDGETYKSSGGEMVESELGMIPKNWEVKKIQDVGEVIAGGTPSTKNKEYYNGNIPWITPKDLSGYDRKFISKGERSITELGLQKSSAKLMRKGTVLFSSRAPIGYIVIAEEDVTTNQGFKSIACNEDIINNNYVYYYLKFNKEKIENVASGSTFKEVSGATMKMFDILVPTMDILNKFRDVVESYDQILRSNYIENDALIQLRNSLLPKLMNGEIRV